METVMEMPVATLVAGPAVARFAGAPAVAAASTLGPVRSAARWFPVCRLSDLEDSWGEAAHASAMPVHE
ncbi:hypothetical protein ART_4061 [Arthrobacter sp. PAMC 25486]|uniref:hypothetical protein n=1 Tax=Arthrobacter sp. PAMC 25486 TaxID=1494608 RepID=UPI000535B2F8|nr:hypothetical protein [Arthrobacter sp. PAMC 25486]AIY03660.1 hypothetical protein ART_4061 [Arthrobacter sp. PAMC 25486]